MALHLHIPFPGVLPLTNKGEITASLRHICATYSSMGTAWKTRQHFLDSVGLIVVNATTVATSTE